MTEQDPSPDIPPSGFIDVSAELTERAQQGDLYWDHEDEEWLPIPRTQLGMYLASFCRVVRKPATIAIDCKFAKACEHPPAKAAFIKRIRRTRGPV